LRGGGIRCAGVAVWSGCGGFVFEVRLRVSFDLAACDVRRGFVDLVKRPNFFYFLSFYHIYGLLSNKLQNTYQTL
jgi:hypothetical protein